MKKWLNKEYTFKKKVWVTLLEALLDSIILTAIFYYCVTKYNSNIVQLLNSISTNNNGFAVSKIMFLGILIIVTTIKLVVQTCGTEKVETSKKMKKK